MMKKFLALLVVFLIGVAGVSFFFYHFGHNDTLALTEFSTAYQNYDRAYSDLSAVAFTNSFEGSPAYDDLEQTADQALEDLNLKASARISSLTRNDAEIMSLTRMIAELSGKELTALKAYHSAMADNDPELAQLSSELEDLHARRQAAYARFQELSGY